MPTYLLRNLLSSASYSRISSKNVSIFALATCLCLQAYVRPNTHRVTDRATMTSFHKENGAGKEMCTVFIFSSEGQKQSKQSITKSVCVCERERERERIRLGVPTAHKVEGQRGPDPLLSAGACFSVVPKLPTSATAVHGLWQFWKQGQTKEEGGLFEQPLGLSKVFGHLGRSWPVISYFLNRSANSGSSTTRDIQSAT